MIIENQQDNHGKNGEKKGPWLEPQIAIGEDAASSPGSSAPKVEAEESPPVSRFRMPLRKFHEHATHMLRDAKKTVRAKVGDAGRRLAPIEPWLQENARLHPYRLMAATSGASFLAGAIMRRFAMLGAGVTLGLFTAFYLGRRSTEAAPMSPSAIK